MAEYRKTIKDIDVKGKYVMVRAGLDVPLDSKKDLLDPQRVTDDTRIRDILPTLKYLIENKPLAQRLGQQARQDVKENFSKEKMIRETFKQYQ